MSAAELLLRRLVEQAGGGAETGYVLVIDGEGLEDLPPQVPTPQATYGVHRARTELGLRQLLWQARGAPIIAVLPEELARRIRQAPDLLRRARNQRVHSLQVTDVLEVALGVRVVGAEPPWLQQLALDHVDRLSEEMRRRTLPTVVDRRLLTELLIDACVGEQVRSRALAELLAGWLREPPPRLPREAATTARPSRRVHPGTTIEIPLPLRPGPAPSAVRGSVVSGMALARSARIVYTSSAEPRGLLARPERKAWGSK